MLWQRLLFGAILIAVLLGLLYFDQKISSAAQPYDRLHGLIVTLVVTALVVLGTRELLRMVRRAGFSPLGLWPIMANVVLVALPCVLANDLVRCDSPRTAVHQLSLAWIVLVFTGTAFLIAARRRVDGSLGNLAVTLFAVLYLGLLPQYIVQLRVFAPAGGVWLILYFVAVVKVCDIGAYFTGYFLGRHKLIPWLSPKKTVEGLVGGIVTSMAVSVWFAGWLRGQPGLADVFSSRFGPAQSAAIFGLVMAVLGQAGDLLESLLKRDAEMKDSAGAVPAFGGVLDILDSILLTAPFACWWLLE